MHRTFGGPAVLELEQVPDPEPGPGEVRVRVHAAALNPVDWKIFSGTAAATSRGLEPPLGVGNDIAGVVDAVGEGVPDLAVGDRVFGSARTRAMQDRTIVDPAVERLARIPDGLDDVRASALVVAGRTAWAGVEQLHLERGETLLVNGAAGGVGVLAVQLASHRGIRVLGTASERNHDRLRVLGAEPVAYGEGLVDRLRALGGVDAVFETHGTAGIDAGIALGVPVARMVGIATKGHAGVAGVATDLAVTGALDELAALAADGTLDVPIAGTVPLEDAADAYRVLMGGHVHGKLVVDLLAG
ncbi:NADP-dependent oxidoreductase [Agrococcus versicolor]